MLINTDSTFGERLIQALSLHGITGPEKQIEKISQVFGVKPKTAEKYLQSELIPAFMNNRGSKFVALAKELGVSLEWLVFGSGHQWQPVIAVAAGFDEHGLEQAKIIRLESVPSQLAAWRVAREAFRSTIGATVFSINRVETV